MHSYDYQTDNYDTLAEISQGVGYAEVLGIAANKDIFTAIGTGKPQEQIPALWDFDTETSEKFLRVLINMGLLGKRDGYIFNTPVAAKYLDSKSPACSLEPLIQAVPSPLFLAEQLLPYFAAVAFEEPAKVTADCPIDAACFGNSKDLSFQEGQNCSLILAGKDYEVALKDIADHGYLVIAGEFAELDTLPSALNALRRHLAQKEAMMPSLENIKATLTAHDMVYTPLLPLSKESGCVIAAKEDSLLKALTFTKEERLIAALKGEETQSIKAISTADIVTADWVADHCRWGCSSYGEKCCPPKSPTYQETETSLKTYTKALLIEGQPPTKDFQKRMLEAEKTAFKAGYYKAFAYWAGPCSLCSECKLPAPPKKCTATRPSMESAGIDVFATVRKQGYALETRKNKTEFVKYFGLLLLD